MKNDQSDLVLAGCSFCLGFVFAFRKFYISEGGIFLCGGWGLFGSSLELHSTLSFYWKL